VVLPVAMPPGVAMAMVVDHLSEAVPLPRSHLVASPMPRVEEARRLDLVVEVVGPMGRPLPRRRLVEEVGPLARPLRLRLLTLSLVKLTLIVDTGLR
jgi:hypothetical protein